MAREVDVQAEPQNQFSDAAADFLGPPGGQDRVCAQCLRPPPICETVPTTASSASRTSSRPCRGAPKDCRQRFLRVNARQCAFACRSVTRAARRACRADDVAVHRLPPSVAHKISRPVHNDAQLLGRSRDACHRAPMFPGVPVSNRHFGGHRCVRAAAQGDDAWARPLPGVTRVYVTVGIGTGAPRTAEWDGASASISRTGRTSSGGRSSSTRRTQAVSSGSTALLNGRTLPTGRISVCRANGTNAVGYAENRALRWRRHNLVSVVRSPSRSMTLPVEQRGGRYSTRDFPRLRRRPAGHIPSRGRFDTSM